MAWSGKVYPEFRIDTEREWVAFRRALVRRQVAQYLGLDACPHRLQWLEFGLFYYRLTLVMEHYRMLPEGSERCALRPLLAEAMLFLKACRAAMSDRATAASVSEEDAFGFLGDTWIPPF
ncbi:MAG: hypothetical protein H5T65_13720 [Chloroflexi bacterium]|nr:hypothetical protein [Chloroflexota bacterium]